MNMSEVIDGIVGVNMESKYSQTGERRIKFEDNPVWYGCDKSLEGDLGRGWKVKARVEGTGNDAKILKVKVIEKSAPAGGGKAPYNGPRGGGGGGKSSLTKEEWAAKDLTIRYQHAQKVGVSLLELQLSAGVFKVPAKGKEEAFMTQFDRLVAGVFSDIGKQEAVGRVTSETDESDEMEAEVETDELDDGDAELDDDGFDDEL